MDLCFSCILPVFSLTSVHAAGAKVKDLEDEADRLLEKLQPIKKLQDNLRRNISQIKELINQARKQANSVRGAPNAIYTSLYTGCTADKSIAHKTFNMYYRTLVFMYGRCSHLQRYI